MKVDLVVDGRLIIDVKAVDRLHPVHKAQVITYLKLTGCPAGLLLNFNAPSLRSSPIERPIWLHWQDVETSKRAISEKRAARDTPNRIRQFAIILTT